MSSAERTVKLAFLDFWDGFDPQNNFFGHYFARLLPGAEIRLVPHEQADIVMFSCFGRTHKSVSRERTVKIFYTGENVRPNFKQCDFSFSFDLDDHEGRNVRIPLWYLYVDWFGVGSYQNPSYLISPANFTGSWFSAEKPKPCCAVISNLIPTRLTMLQALAKYVNIDCFGIPFGNATSGEEDKYRKISGYRASICMENGVYPGYVTEKLLHARTAGNLAVYYGCRESGIDFNRNGYINVADFESFDECAHHVAGILADEARYREIVSQPIFSSPFFQFEDKVRSILSKVL